MTGKDDTLAKFGLSSRAIHGDAPLGDEVAPNISLTTTFRHPLPGSAKATTEWSPADPVRDIYSRYTQPTLTRTEQALSAIIGTPTILYPSGISAAYSALLFYQPHVIAVTGGYHGCHESFKVYSNTREDVKIIALDDPYPKGKRVLCWLETPVNPTGESRSIEAYAKKVHEVGGKIIVDSTFGPPPLQDPFAWGADIVMHSGTKYFGGHSDALAGTLSVKDKADWLKLWHNRTYTGSSVGSLEAWLILRSLRTLDVRVRKQSATATALAQWLSSLTRSSPDSDDLDGPLGVVSHVWSTTLQDLNGRKWIGPDKQMTGGPACFAILLSKTEYAEQLGHQLKLFIPATSLGGVESLIEQRVVSDAGADPRLVRLSIGLEDFEDLKEDLKQGLRKVVELGKSKSKL
ncbi:cystathionine gamma-synthase [Meredithblackwellia eburnea MCA 4105]